jgi:membrane-bound metal-dependent hydrolase YbcI (DUF457 family)
LHAVLALATRSRFSTERGFALGLTLGSLLPDVDSYPQAAAVLIGGMDPAQAEAIYHRTLTHSWLFAVGLLAVFIVAGYALRRPAVRTFGVGLFIGVALLHVAVDILAWFDGVGLLWPLWSVNLWPGVVLPDVAANLLRAGNFWAFALYFAYLASIARRRGSATAYLPRLRLYTWVQVGLGVLFTALAFALPFERYNTPDGAVFLFWAYPNALWVTWRMRAAIESGAA